MARCSLTTAEKHNLFLPKQTITGILTDVLHAFTSRLLQFTQEPNSPFLLFAVTSAHRALYYYSHADPEISYAT